MLAALAEEASSRKCPVAKGLYTFCATYRFVAALYLQADVLPHIAMLSKVFQRADVNFLHIKEQVDYKDMHLMLPVICIISILLYCCMFPHLGASHPSYSGENSGSRRDPSPGNVPCSARPRPGQPRWTWGLQHCRRGGEDQEGTRSSGAPSGRDVGQICQRCKYIPSYILFQYFFSLN